MELEVTLKPSKIRTLNKFIFGDIRDKKNNQRIHEFTDFPFHIDSTEYEEKISKVKRIFP